MFIVLERIDNPVRGQLAQAEQVWLTYYAKLSSSPRPYNARLWVWRSDDGEMERYAAARRSKAAGQGGAVSADVWAVPLMSFDQIAIQPDDVWKDVSRELLNGWGGKCQDAVRLNRNAVLATGDELSGYWLTIPVARIANELGAPVQQLFTACALRRRPTTPPAEP